MKSTRESDESTTQDEFDQLATFVAVADELFMEPFMSEDNWIGSSITTSRLLNPINKIDIAVIDSSNSEGSKW